MKGRGNSLDFGARMYDSRLGRWLSIDPLAAKFPSVSPYAFAYNNPIFYIDKEGEEPTAAAYKKAAESLGVPIAAIRSVYITETGGNAYYSDGKLKILFERHYFHKSTNGKFAKSNSDLSNPVRGGYGKYSQQHPKFEKAKALDEEAAYFSTSFTGFQIMGANYKDAGDFKSAKEFGDAMLNGSEDDHLNAFVSYVKNNSSLHKNLKKQDWTKFAEGYNGPAYKDNDYDTKMKNNYEKLKDNPLEGLSDDKENSSSNSFKSSPPPFDSALEGLSK